MKKLAPIGTKTSANNNETEEEFFEFYNESKAADYDIFPFDIIAEKTNIDLDKEEFSLKDFSNEEHKYEFSIQDDKKNNSCVFEI